MADPILIEVEKDGEVLRVHPTALEQHLALGWQVVDKPRNVEKAAKVKTEPAPAAPEAPPPPESPEE